MSDIPIKCDDCSEDATHSRTVPYTIWVCTGEEPHTYLGPPPNRDRICEYDQQPVNEEMRNETEYFCAKHAPPDATKMKK
jgi:hypothetical protein